MKTQIKNRLVTLLTKNELKKLYQNYKESEYSYNKGEEATAFEPVVKFFNPSGLGTWYLSELSPENIGFCICCLHENEIGYVSLNELANLRLPIPIEKDMHFSAEGMTITEYKNKISSKEIQAGNVQNCSISTQKFSNIENKSTLLVKDHIIYDQNHLVNTCLNDYTFDHDDISNMCGFFDQDGYQILDDKLEEAQERDDFDSLYHEEYKEIYTWYLVTEWLARKLNKKGEVILDNEHGTWWGRTSFGQLIVCDSVIQEIAKEHY